MSPNLPGFNAAAALGATAYRYRSSTSTFVPGNHVVPQLMSVVGKHNFEMMFWSWINWLDAQGTGSGGGGGGGGGEQFRSCTTDCEREMGRCTRECDREGGSQCRRECYQGFHNCVSKCAGTPP